MTAYFYHGDPRGSDCGRRVTLIEDEYVCEEHGVLVPSVHVWRYSDQFPKNSPYEAPLDRFVLLDAIVLWSVLVICGAGIGYVLARVL